MEETNQAFNKCLKNLMQLLQDVMATPKEMTFPANRTNLEDMLINHVFRTYESENLVTVVMRHAKLLPLEGKEIQLS